MAQATQRHSTTQVKARPRPPSMFPFALESVPTDELRALYECAMGLVEVAVAFNNQPRNRNSDTFNTLVEAAGWGVDDVMSEVKKRQPADAEEAEHLARVRIAHLAMAGEGLPEVAALAAQLALPYRN